MGKTTMIYLDVPIATIGQRWLLSHLMAIPLSSCYIVTSDFERIGVFARQVDFETRAPTSCEEQV